MMKAAPSPHLRQNLAQERRIGFTACVALARMRELCQADGPAFLSVAEYTRWRNFPSDKRRLDFAGGRLAAKLAGYIVRRVRSMRSLPLSELHVGPDSQGQPWLWAPDAPPQRIAISHAAGVARAVCMLDPLCAGVDVVESGRTLPFDADYFHLSEADSYGGRVDRSICFSIKEATLKALGMGLNEQAAAIWSIVDEQGQRWVGLPAPLVERACFESYTLLHETTRTTCMSFAQVHRTS